MFAVGDTVNLYLLKSQITGMLLLSSCFPIDLTFVHCICCALHSCLNLSLASNMQLLSVSFPLLDTCQDLVELVNASEVQRWAQKVIETSHIYFMCCFLLLHKSIVHKISMLLTMHYVLWAYSLW